MLHYIIWLIKYQADDSTENYPEVEAGGGGVVHFTAAE